MFRRFTAAAVLLASSGVLASCSTDDLLTAPSASNVARFAIADAAIGSPIASPEFFWLTPTVAVQPASDGAFDPDALSELEIEICELATLESCAGAPFELLNSTTLPMPSRLRVDAAREHYEATWLTGRTGVAAGRNYRVSVLRSGTLLGYVDVAMVKNTPALATVQRDEFTPLVKGQQFVIRFRIEQPVARNYVKINEVESNQGTPGDWVELYNTNALPFDLSGYIFRDNDNTHTYVIPDGTTIAGNGFLVLEESQFDFGLGAAEMARLFMPDGATIVDSHAWSSHAPLTYGRCPDGSGAFAPTTQSTKGNANECSVLVRINEIESNGGTPGDWVELFNPGTAPISLGGYVFRDNNDAAGFVIPAGTIIAAGSYLLLEEAQLGFGLGASDAARLFRSDGVLVDSHVWPSHAPTTYGRCPNATGGFVTTATSTKGSANDCAAPVATVRINEVESNGGTPGDWVELYNTSAAPVDLSGYVFRDNDITHTYTLPAGSIVAAGGFLVLEEADFGFGLGGNEQARLFAPGGVTLVDMHEWTAHAAITYGRCPDGTGAWTSMSTSTKGAANDCRAAVRINEVESSGGTPGDWVEFYNVGASPVDLSGYIFRDNNPDNSYVLPAESVIPAGGYLVIDEAQIGFGLGGADAARLFASDGTTIIDAYEWTAHATTTYGRCPDGSGAFATTTSSTKGSVNVCPGDLIVSAWAGGSTVTTVDVTSYFGTNMSGLSYVGTGTSTPGVLWATKNGPGTLYRLVWNGTNYVPDAGNDWGNGKALRYPDGLGDVDAEGISAVGASLYVASERNNSASSISRNSILRYDANAAGTALTALNEWNLTADLPVTGANLGAEAVTFVPDAFLVAQGFYDESKAGVYAPADYPNNGGGLFFVGLEATGGVYVYALNHVTNGYTRVATIVSGYTGAMGLEIDTELGQLWIVCDDTCNGRSVVMRIDTQVASPTQGRFVVVQRFERPADMPNINNEGFAIAPLSECVTGMRPAFWSDDNNTGSQALRRGTVPCAPF